MTKCKMARLFRQVSKSFGDGGAAQGLEVAILKFVAAAAILLVTKFLLECIRYSNNLLYSFKNKKEYLSVKEDLEKSFTMHSMPLKYCITNSNHDPNKHNHPARGPEKIEKMLGIHWCLLNDTITAVSRYNLNGSSRGKELGTLLKNMSDEEIMGLTITRMTFLWLSAQTY